MSTMWKVYRSILDGLPNDELRTALLCQTNVKKTVKNREELLDTLASEYVKNGSIEPIFSVAEDHIHSLYKPMFTSTNLSYQNQALVVKRLVQMWDEEKNPYPFTFYWTYFSDGRQSFEADVSGLSEEKKPLFLTYYDWKYNFSSYESLAYHKWDAFLRMCHQYHESSVHAYTYQDHVPYQKSEHFFYITINDYPHPVELIYEQKKCVDIGIPEICDYNLKEVFNLEEIQQFIEEKAPSRLLFLFE